MVLNLEHKFQDDTHKPHPTWWNQPSLYMSEKGPCLENFPYPMSTLRNGNVACPWPCLICMTLSPFLIQKLVILHVTISLMASYASCRITKPPCSNLRNCNVVLYTVNRLWAQ